MMSIRTIKFALSGISIAFFSCVGVMNERNGKVVAAPVPKDTKYDGLIWLHDFHSNELVSFTPNGIPFGRFSLEKGEVFLSLTPEGRQLLFAASARAGFIRTYHIRQFRTSAESSDLGIPYHESDHIVGWTRDCKSFLRGCSEDFRKNVGVRAPVLKYDIIDISTKAILAVDTPPDVRILGWTPDEKQFIGQGIGIGRFAFRGLCIFTSGEESTELALNDCVSPITLTQSGDGKMVLIGGWKLGKDESLHHALYRLDPVAITITEIMHENHQNLTTAVVSPDHKMLAVLWAHAESPKVGWDGFRLTICTMNGENRRTVKLASPDNLKDPRLLSWLPGGG